MKFSQIKDDKGEEGFNNDIAYIENIANSNKLGKIKDQHQKQVIYDQNKQIFIEQKNKFFKQQTGEIKNIKIVGNNKITKLMIKQVKQSYLTSVLYKELEQLYLKMSALKIDIAKLNTRISALEINNAKQNTRLKTLKTQINSIEKRFNEQEAISQRSQLVVFITNWFMNQRFPFKYNSTCEFFNDKENEARNDQEFKEFIYDLVGDQDAWSGIKLQQKHRNEIQHVNLQKLISNQKIICCKYDEELEGELKIYKNIIEFASDNKRMDDKAGELKQKHNDENEKKFKNMKNNFIKQKKKD